MITTFSVSFAALSTDCADPAVLADFWGKALGRPVSPGAVPGDMAVDATDPEGNAFDLVTWQPEQLPSLEQ